MPALMAIPARLPQALLIGGTITGTSMLHLGCSAGICDPENGMPASACAMTTNSRDCSTADS
jgi:hypothetical protein